MSFSSWPFWIGGIVGNFLPDLDHLIYAYFLRPHELTSQRVGYLVGQRRLIDGLRLLAVTRSERTKLIFHTAGFQLIFLVLTFLVVTSSGSLLGRGVVLAFFLHLLVDQAIDFMEGADRNWFGGWGYWLIMLFVFLVFAFLL